MKRISGLIIALMGSLWTCVMAQQTLTTSEITKLNTVAGGEVVSIHDPSVVLHDGLYTVWGSHRGLAQSNDLVSWRPLNGNDVFVTLPSQGATSGTTGTYATAFRNQQVTQVKNYKGELVSMPNFNAEAYCNRYAANKASWIGGNMWAPDIVYNPTMKKWCMYLSLNGDNWSSIIVLLTAPSPTGPFTYQAPVVMGGFNGQKYGGVSAPQIGETDFTIATGQTSLPARYIRGDNGTYWPNCIDPCSFFDEDGELWLAYGSWSGGIFMLKLDKETGLRDYTYTYESDYATKGASGVSDPYFGKKIAGGYYVSGEGPYIQHIGEYYYLFMSYGFYSPDGGYEMRIFRSKTPDGPYVDGNGIAATYTGGGLNYGPNANTNRGMKLMGSYNHWGELQNIGECAQGHNSACVDSEGRAFVMYHTKFKDNSAGHQVRTHQLFVNEKGWLVAAPFCYRGETTTVEDIASKQLFANEELVGEYQVMAHKYKMTYNPKATESLDTTCIEMVEPIRFTLNADGTVSGDKTGTWTTTPGTSYITLKLSNVNYYGVVCPQSINGATNWNYQVSGHQAIGITTTSSSGVALWAHKLEPKSAIARNYTKRNTSIRSNIYISENQKLLFETTDNAKVQWTSSRPEVIDEGGRYNPYAISERTPVELTQTISCGDWAWTETYNVTANPNSNTWDFRNGLVAYYSFDDERHADSYSMTDVATLNKFGRSTPIPAIEQDMERNGSYVHTAFGAQKYNSYVMMNNPLYGAKDLNAFTLSMWVKRNDANLWDAIWGFFTPTTADAADARLYMTGNTYLGFNDNAGTWFDLNHPGTATYTSIPVGEWTLVTLVMEKGKNKTRLYINGTLVAFKTFATNAGDVIARNFDATAAVSKVTEMEHFWLGMGSFWGSADICVDDILFYNRALTTTEITSLKTLSNRVHDFGPLRGDVNGDGKITIADMPALIAILTGTQTSTINADVNCDGKIDKNDIGALVSKLL